MKSLIFLALMACINLTAQDKLLLRHPAINADGSLVAFSFQGDIWTVPSKGGKATRLTIHEAYEGNPVFSPDGSKIAFSGSRFGNNDIYTIPSNGGLSKRLTFHSSGDLVTSWTQADKILFSTNREFRQIERPSEIYSISPNGGTESRLLDAVGFDASLSPNGRFILYVRGDINPVAREDYDGSSNREMWIYDTKIKKHNLLKAYNKNDVTPQWAGNGLIYFLSSESGSYNLYQMKLTSDGEANGKPVKLTNFTDEAIRSFSVAANGSTIVFEKDMNIYLFKPSGGGGAEAIKIDISADERLDATESKSLSDNASEYAVSPNGKYMAYAIRGEIFLKENDKEKSYSINISQHAHRDQDPAWLNDSTLLFTSDRDNGNFDIYQYISNDTSQQNFVKSMKHQVKKMTSTSSDESSIVVASDGKKIAFVRGKGTFIIADIDSTGNMINERVMSESWSAPSGVSWSPDNKWIAYSQNDLYYNEEVFIQSIETGAKPINVSMHPRGDSRPVWSLDGSKLGFLSRRSTNRNSNVWFAWLKREDWEKSSQDWQDKEPSADASAKPSKDKKAKPIKIDKEDIHNRLVQVTNIASNAGNLCISADGETFYYTTANTNAKGNDLYSIKWDGKDLKDLTKGGTNPFNVTMDKEGKYLYFAKQSGSLNRIEMKSGTSEFLPYMAKMKINYIKERSQVYEEAWRTIRDGFYDPQFHGYDWAKLRDKYKERCIYASTSNDFRDMFNLMLGELNSSHMGLSVADRVETQNEATGWLGAEVVPVIGGGVRVTHVVPETPAYKEKSKLAIGDVITSINGEPINESVNFHSLLNGMSNEKILLNVKDINNVNREVIIRPTSNISDNLYEEWVANRNKLVEKYSGGRLGYLHIRGMDFPSFEETERAFMAAGYGKDGLIIDVRYNGGGSTADFLMTMLNYKQHAYTIPRGASENLERDKLKFRDYYPVGERLVYASWMKPSITICNEGSYSNAEIFSHAYKTLGIGKLVGLPTNGSVISTGGKGLMDGSFIRLPLRGWYNIKDNKNQELGAAIPDIIVENQPDWIAKGTDEQLKVAVEELLKTLK